MIQIFPNDYGYKNTRFTLYVTLTCIRISISLNGIEVHSISNPQILTRYVVGPYDAGTLVIKVEVKNASITKMTIPIRNAIKIGDSELVNITKKHGVGFCFDSPSAVLVPFKDRSLMYVPELQTKNAIFQDIPNLPDEHFLQYDDDWLNLTRFVPTRMFHLASGVYLWVQDTKEQKTERMYSKLKLFNEHNQRVFSFPSAVPDMDYQILYVGKSIALEQSKSNSVDIYSVSQINGKVEFVSTLSYDRKQLKRSKLTVLKSQAGTFELTQVDLANLENGTQGTIESNLVDFESLSCISRASDDKVKISTFGSTDVVLPQTQKMIEYKVFEEKLTGSHRATSKQGTVDHLYYALKSTNNYQKLQVEQQVQKFKSQLSPHNQEAFKEFEVEMKVSEKYTGQIHLMAGGYVVIETITSELAYRLVGSWDIGFQKARTNVLYRNEIEQTLYIVKEDKVQRIPCSDVCVMTVSRDLIYVWSKQQDKHCTVSATEERMLNKLEGKQDDVFLLGEDLVLIGQQNGYPYVRIVDMDKRCLRHEGRLLNAKNRVTNPDGSCYINHKRLILCSKEESGDLNFITLDLDTQRESYTQFSMIQNIAAVQNLQYIPHQHGRFWLYNGYICDFLSGNTPDLILWQI